jgi:hypothetical protein
MINMKNTLVLALTTMLLAACTPAAPATDPVGPGEGGGPAEVPVNEKEK